MYQDTRFCLQIKDRTKKPKTSVLANDSPKRTVLANDNSTEALRSLIQTAFVKGESLGEDEGES